MTPRTRAADAGIRLGPPASGARQRAVHPDPDGVRRTLAVLGVDLQVTAGPRPSLAATLGTARGRIEIA
ncbi:MAG: hypothetical protein AB7H88_06305 [Vicinamibacterales bacterium]